MCSSDLEPDLRAWFAQDADRARRFTFELADLHVDLSKNLVTDEVLALLVQLAEQMDFLFVAPEAFTIAPESWERVAGTERLDEILDAVAAHLAGCEWTPEAIDLRPALEPLGVKPRKALPAVYAAVEGRHAGLPLFDSIHLLGREESLARIAAARARR